MPHPVEQTRPRGHASSDVVMMLSNSSAASARTTIRRRWAIVVLYVGVIYGTIPFAPRLWLRASSLTGLTLPTLALAICGGASLVALVCIRRRIRSWAAMGGITALGCAYAAIYRLQFEAPAERLHLLEYGVLPWLVQRAWEMSGGVRGSLAGAFVVSALVGAVDEVIQGLTPGRFAQMSDVISNWESALLGVAGLMLIRRASERPSARCPRFER